MVLVKKGTKSVQYFLNSEFLIELHDGVIYFLLRENVVSAWRFQQNVHILLFENDKHPSRTISQVYTRSFYRYSIDI